MKPDCSVETLIMKLKFIYFGHLMGKEKSLEKTLMLVKQKMKAVEKQAGRR